MATTVLGLLAVPLVSVSAVEAIGGFSLFGGLGDADPFDGPNAAPFKGATGWINSPALAAPALRGKVVLVDFWTYSCINWLRTLPYLRAWADKYRRHGLVVIGVHSPEFEFEKDPVNVRAAVKSMGIDYPIAIDSNFAIWRAFGNQYWPALYLVDSQGRIRDHVFGEGGYEAAELRIRELLLEAGAAGLDPNLARVNGKGIEAAPQPFSLWSPETYLGYQRSRNFQSRGKPLSERRQDFSAPSALSLNSWALAGDWTIERQFVRSNTAGGRIAYQFHARDAHLVMGASVPGAPVRFRVRIDREAPGKDQGLDVDSQGNGAVAEPRLYQLVRQRGEVRDRQVEIEFLDAGVEAYVFTFG